MLADINVPAVGLKAELSTILFCIAPTIISAMQQVV